MSVKRVVAAYVSMMGLFTLAASMIWAINTIFLMRLGGLGLFEVMLVNSSFTVAQMLFEVPTGVIADTIGRKASILLSMLTLAISTLMYVVVPRFGWGLPGFVAASVLLGLGYTFQTGAVDAWVFDALTFAGWDQPKDRVFGWGMMTSSAAMVLGSLLGGVLGQFDLVTPYLVRAGLLGACFVLVFIMVSDQGFESRTFRLSKTAEEARRILRAGVRWGWRSAVVRPMLLASGISGIFFMYSFYAWQPYVLGLLGRDSVWLLGVVQAASSLASIAGNALAGRLGRRGAQAGPLLAWLTAVTAVASFAIGIAGTGRGPSVPAATAAIVLWIVWGVAYGASMPIRMGFINEHIPSSERATVLSVDALFLDAGGAVGQPGLGFIAERRGAPISWLIGGVLLAVSAPFYTASGRAANAETDGPSFGDRAPSAG